MSFIFFFSIQYYFLIYQEILRKKESNAPDSFFKLQSCFATPCFRTSRGNRTGTKNGRTPAACLACAGKKLLSHLVAFFLLAQPSKGSKIPSTAQNNPLLNKCRYYVLARKRTGEQPSTEGKGWWSRGTPQFSSYIGVLPSAEYLLNTFCQHTTLDTPTLCPSNEITLR